MTQIKPNQQAPLEDVKNIFENAKIEGDKIIFDPENFRGFSWMLRNISNPFQGASKEVQEYIISFCKERGITKSAFSHTPDWAI